MANANELTKKQQEILNKCLSMKEDEIVTIAGIDYSTLDKLAEENSWAEWMLEQEYSGWLLRTSEDSWEPALNCCYPPRYNKEELIELIKNSRPIITDPEEIKAEVLGDYDYDEEEEE